MPIPIIKNLALLRENISVSDGTGLQLHTFFMLSSTEHLIYPAHLC